MLGLKIIFATVALVLANFHPDQIFYDVINNKVKIEFAQQIEQAAATEIFFQLIWRAPEIIQQNSKPVS